MINTTELYVEADQAHWLSNCDGLTSDWLAHRAAAVNLMRLVNLGLVHDGRGWVIAG
jgi:hypothetical protein